MNRSLSYRASRRAFTLIELLVVIAIIGVLVAILLPAVQRAREAGNRITCTNNLKQIGIGIHTFHDGQNTLPPVSLAGQGTYGAGTSFNVSQGFTWAMLILPFIEQQSLFDQFTALNTQLHSYNAGTIGAVAYNSGASLKPYLCPSRRTGVQRAPATGSGNANENGACSDYAAVAISSPDGSWSNATAAFNTTVNNPSQGHLGMLIFAERTSSATSAPTQSNWRGRTTLNVPDGTTNTIMVGEKHLGKDDLNKTANGDGSIYYYSTGTGIANNSMRKVTFYNSGATLHTTTTTNTSIAQRGSAEPTTSTSSQLFGSWHPQICQFLIGDGSVRQIKSSIAADVLGKMADRRDGLAFNTDP